VTVHALVASSVRRKGANPGPHLVARCRTRVSITGASHEQDDMIWWPVSVDLDGRAICVWIAQKDATSVQVLLNAA
jgi:hypothetical protein